MCDFEIVTNDPGVDAPPKDSKHDELADGDCVMWQTAKPSKRIDLVINCDDGSTSLKKLASQLDNMELRHRTNESAMAGRHNELENEGVGRSETLLTAGNSINEVVDMALVEVHGADDINSTNGRGFGR